MGFSKDVALKVTRLDSEELNQQHIEAMINEGRAQPRVRHSNVVDIYDLGQEGPRTYMAMEFVSGFTFRHLIDRSRSRGTRLPDSVIIDLAIGATQAHAAHKAVDEEGQALGLVHRDIKPSNLMLDQWGGEGGGLRQCLCEHQCPGDRGGGHQGYARLHGARAVARLGRRPPADIFSLGVVLWELVSCRVLFEGKAVMRSTSGCRQLGR